MINDQALALAKLALGTVAGTAAPSLFGFDHYIEAFIGVPFTVVGMAAAGAMMSFAFGQTERKRFKLLATAIAATLIGAAAVTAVPEFTPLDPVSDGARPVAGFFYALFARWTMPIIIDVIPMLIRRWLNIPVKQVEGDTP